MWTSALHHVNQLTQIKKNNKILRRKQSKYTWLGAKQLFLTYVIKTPPTKQNKTKDKLDFIKIRTFCA